jgi:hypothetical protein
MAKYRGSKGSLTLAGTAIGELIEWELDIARAHIDGTAMGASAQGGGDLDLPGATGRIRVRFDHANAQQASLDNILVSDASPTPIAAVFIISSTGPKQITCNILPVSMGVGARVMGGYIEATYQIRSDGTIAFSWT